MTKSQNKDLTELRGELDTLESTLMEKLSLAYGAQAAYRYYDLCKPNKKITDTLITKAYKVLTKIIKLTKRVKSWKLTK